MAAAVTLTKLGSTTLGSEYTPSASTDLIFEMVHVKLATTADWIECADGANAQTQMVRRPVGCVFGATNALAAACVGTAAGIWATVTGTRIIITCAGTIADSEFDVLIVGFAN